MRWQKSRSDCSKTVLFFIVPLLVLAAITGCGQPKNRMREAPLARVHNQYLYPRDLMGIIPQGSSATDSALIARSYVNQWIRKRVMLKQAEFNLTAEQQNVQQLLDEYRASLLIYEYEKEMLVQKMDTTVSDHQIEEYYYTHLEDFKLLDPIIKGVFIKVPADASDLNNIRTMVRSSTNQSYTNLINTIVEDHLENEAYEENWIPMIRLLQKIPVYLDDIDDFLRRNRYLERQQGNIVSFIRILEFKLAGETAPLDYMNTEIRDIILNRRKVEFINSLQESVYDDAVLQNQIEIYDNY